MIDDDVLRARIPRLGSITTGLGVEATAKSGATYSKPTRANTIVFHCGDEQVASAVQGMYGGRISTDSPNWACDVITDVRDVTVGLLPQGFRQALESWRAAECLRRCDGVRMNTAGGRPVDQPCACQPEMERGADRTCSPSTILPCFIDLPVERFGVWEIRSTSWGTAAALKGTMRALAMVGAVEGMVPAVLSMVSRTVRDSKGKVHEVEEFQATIAQTRQALEALAGKAAALDAHIPPGLQAGVDPRRLELLEEWERLSVQLRRAGLRDTLLADWRTWYASRDVADLSVEELTDWIRHVTDRLWDAGDDAERPPAPPEPEGEGNPPDQPPEGESG